MANKNKLVVQGLIFDKQYYPNKTSVRNWISKHPEFKLMKDKRVPIEKTEKTYRVRQKHPWYFKKSTLKEIKLTKSIVKVVGKLK